MSVKLSQISSGGTLVPSTDQLVTVRSGTTDVLTSVGTAALKSASNNSNPTLASVSTSTITSGHVATFADASGTIQDGGTLGTAANQAASSVTGTVAAVSGGTTAGHIATFTNTAGTIQDGGALAFSNVSGTVAATQLPTATTSTLGAVQIDGTTITIAGGVISAATGAAPAYLIGSGTATNSGTGGSALGAGCQVYDYAFAAGNTAVAAPYSVVIGYSSTGATYHTVAIGHQAVCGGSSASGIAIGYQASAQGAQSICIGTSAVTASGGSNEIAIGTGASASGGYALAIGQGSVAGYPASIVIGNAQSASTAGDIIIGCSGNPTIAVNGSTHNMTIPTGGVLLTTSAALTNGAAANTATMTNAPVSGNPTKWIPISDNGTTRYIPVW